MAFSSHQLGALFSVIFMVFSWLALAELLHESASKPMVLTYIVHSFYALYLLPAYYLLRHKTDVLPSTRQFIKRMGYMSVLLYVVSYTWYLSLPLTTVAVNTAIYQSASAVVLLLQPLLLHGSKYTITASTLTCVGLSLGGVFLSSFYGPTDGAVVAPDEGEFRGGKTAGFVWVAVSMFGYALYEVLMKRFEQQDRKAAGEPLSGLLLSGEPPSMGETAGVGLLVVGSVGALTALLLWPLVPLASAAGLEHFDIATVDWKTAGLASLLDGAFNAGLVVTIAFASPLFASVGSLLTIPLSLLFAHFFRDASVAWQCAVGMALIVLSFVLMARTEEAADEEEAAEQRSLIHHVGVNATDQIDVSFEQRTA